MVPRPLETQASSRFQAILHRVYSTPCLEARSSQFANAWRLASIAVLASAGLALMRGKHSLTAADAVELNGSTPTSELRRSEAARGARDARRGMEISFAFFS